MFPNPFSAAFTNSTRSITSPFKAKIFCYLFSRKSF